MSANNSSNSNNTTITHYRDWVPDGNHFKFSQAKPNAYQGMNIGLKYCDDRIYLRTPKMRAPFGLQPGYEGKGFTVQLAFDKDNVEAQEFLAKCKQFDAFVRETGRVNAYEWRITKTKDAPVHDAVLDELFKPMVHYPRYKRDHPTMGGKVNPDYPPFIQLTLYEKTPKENEVDANGKPKEAEMMTEVYDCHKVAQPDFIKEETIHGGCSLTSIIFATSAYKSSTGFGVIWRAAQFMVYPKKGLEGGVCHIKPDDDFDNENIQVPKFNPSVTAEPSPPAPADAAASASAAAAAAAADASAQSAPSAPAVSAPTTTAAPAVTAASVPKVTLTPR